MAAKKDYGAICSSIIDVCGGVGNIANVTHCMTRLRVQLKDGSKLNKETASNINGVINLVVQNGEYQFVIGQDERDAIRGVDASRGHQCGWFC